MRAFVGTCFIGSFAFDADGKILDKKLFPKRTDIIADKVRKSRAGEVLPEEREIVQDLAKRGFKEVVWDKKTEVGGIGCVYKKDNLAADILQNQVRKLAMDLRWTSTQSEFNEILSKVQVELTKTELRKERKDFVIMRIIGIVDELDRTINTLSELLREWYGLHFPEMSARVGSNERFAEIVARYGSRDKIEDKGLKELAGKSSGMPLSDDDVRELQGFSKSIITLFEEKKKLTRHLEITTSQAIPNLSGVAGPMLAARLLALAGGLDKISRLPSSTIQLLGAEKALFRHLRGEGKAPKYGVLFGHGYIQNAPKELKGKVARMIASKLTLAARLDKFSDKNRGEELRKDLEDHIRKLKPGKGAEPKGG
jgi:nucleolar protein 56